MREIMRVPITQKELDTVKGRSGIMEQCIAFALLAEAKRLTMECEDRDFWIKGTYRTKIPQKADLTIPADDMAPMVYRMKCDGLIELTPSIKNCSMHILFADPAGRPVMELDDKDLEHLGYCWRAYVGERYTKCQLCGRWVKQGKRGAPRKFCKKCADANHKAANRASMKRTREKFACVH